MKDQFLKIAGVKTDKAFYAKYPTEAAFFAAHPEAKHLKTMAKGGNASGKQQQIMQLIQMYAQSKGIDPKQIMQQLQQMPPQQQQQAIQQMAQTMQQGQQGQQGTAPQPQQQPQMQWGGGLNKYQGGGIGQLDNLVPMVGPMNVPYEQGLSNYNIPPSNGGLSEAISQVGRVQSSAPSNYGIGELAPLSSNNNVPIPVSNTEGTMAKNTPKNLPKKQSESVVDLLDSIGWSSDMASRKLLAKQLNISGYKGTADQNKKMIKTILDNPQQFRGHEGEDETQFVSPIPPHKSDPIIDFSTTEYSPFKNIKRLNTNL